MSRRIRLTNAEWDAVSAAVARRAAELAEDPAPDPDPEAVGKQLAALARSLDKIGEMMRPPAHRPAGSAVSTRRPRSST